MADRPSSSRQSSESGSAFTDTQDQIQEAVPDVEAEDDHTLKANGIGNPANGNQKPDDPPENLVPSVDESNLTDQVTQVVNEDSAQTKEPSDSVVRDLNESPEPPQPVKRKFSSPFAWLTRNSASQDNVKKSPPPLPSRRDTAMSDITIASEDDQAYARRQNRNSLKDRFKLVRMREEAGTTPPPNDTGSRPASGETVKTEEIQEALDTAATEMSAASKHIRTGSGGQPLAAQPELDENLAPGTAAGFTTGPGADSTTSVDWDLWQTVVYEGPAAVARTSSDDLSKAISRGIPSAIRGVIWQVLAQSKNEELEDVYRDLVNRGQDRERRPSEPKSARPAGIRRPQSGLSVEKTAREEMTVSSASSIHSDISKAMSRPTSPMSENMVVSSVTSNDDVRSEQPSIVAAPEKKHMEDDMVALKKLEKVIRRDLGARTSYSKFLMSSGLQEGLFGICKAYALFDEAVGYAQGMNFIAMPLLFNMPEEEAFCLFVRLMNQYHLRDMFIQDMPGLHLHLYQFERLLEDFEPAVYCHLHRRGVQPQLYATQWFLTLFAYRFPLQLVLRIYDLILSEGLESAILKFGIVLMQKNAQTLLTMKDMSALTTFLKERLFDVYIDKSPSASSVLESGFFGSAGGIDKEVYRADALVQDACAVQITPEMLKGYTNEWEEKTKEEKRKQVEEETLRNNNTSLSQRIRNLEAHAEKRDIEHVEIASELVRIKVENQRLSDDNESLTAQVQELQKIIQAQPGEVEEKLKHEMERIMQRNIEVQNENRHLEDQCAEMEAELVNSKMSHAETNTELEDVRSKLNNIMSIMNPTKK